ncbi:calcium binding protein [Holotrichia oblita]|uniref:Calcium binding protein n=1 Tax=Holotrichia oblita TaxID=644536 RepID=A0ACB9T2M2_HOLOL|nr:calcium binding protein [Holotrichia oblita]
MCEGVREFFSKFFISSELNIQSENSDNFGEHKIANDSEINFLRNQVLFRDRLIEHLHDTIKAQSRAIDLLTERIESRDSCTTCDSYETWRDQQDLRTAFIMLDSNNDGKVNTKDLQEMLTRLGIEIKQEIIDELMKLAVGHQQGAEIDENDFLQWVKKIQELLPETTCQDPHKDLMAAFKVFDLDNNGFITRDEIKVAMEKIGEPVTEEQITEMITMADMDMDGRINYEGNFNMQKNL